MKIILYQPCSFKQQGEREYQEDARFPDTDIIKEAQRFFLVCDGVGGSEHGEVASNTVCQAFAKKMDKVNLDNDFTNANFSKILDYAYDQLDNKAKNIEGDMATTLTFICFHKLGCTLAHIGDSRIYQIRKNQGIIYRSDDHSLVNSMVHNGIITPEQAQNHPQSNVITRCMMPVEKDGNRSQATVIRTDNIMDGDFFMLCSDGVLQFINDDMIVEIFNQEGATLQQITDKIASISKQSDDNNTAIIIQVKQVIRTQEEQQEDDNETSEENMTKRLCNMKTQDFEIESVKTEHAKNGIINKMKTFFKK